MIASNSSCGVHRFKRIDLTTPLAYILLVRWAATGRGKRGGVRVIYYWAVDREIILMLLIYGKNEQDDLTAEQLRALKGLVEEEFK
jgi:mRNA-degrading endonuclease RelE of RelBE toxin-antitoxin system